MERICVFQHRRKETIHVNSDCAPLCHLTAEGDSFTVTLTLLANPEHINPDITPLSKTSRFLWHRSERGKPNKAAIIKR